MAVNKYLPHIFILPEDDANRQLAIGFNLKVPSRQLQVLTEAGGWARVRDTFVSDHIKGMEKFPQRHMVLVVDFDDNPGRLDQVKQGIPDHLHDRVFVIGSLSTPEALRQAGLGSYETIGSALAGDCRDGVAVTWEHELLQHNESELARLRESICDVLFQS
jgi:hypothetical protein